ncbi:MAG TPA: hypothetical protein VGD08_26550 [Stellaceae bacterium]|jgi:hypothetical protein
MSGQQGRRLSDKLLAAFDQACEQGHLDVAEQILRTIELALTREGGAGRTDHRHETGPVVDAYARLKALKEKAARR